MIFLSGCNVSLPGERAADVDTCSSPPCGPVCPEGETCASDGPKGLYFAGPGLFDDIGSDGGVEKTALGGTQTIKVLGTKTTAYEGPFDAAGTDAVAIDGVAPPDVTVRGVAEGPGFLRILKPGTQELYDRISLEVASAVAQAHVVPADKVLSDRGENVDWALFAESTVNLAVELRDAENARVVDEGIKIVFSGDATEGGAPELPRWDKFGIKAGNMGTASVKVTTSGGQSFEQTFPVVDALTDIVATPSLNDPKPLDPLAVGGQLVRCFRAVAGDRAVVGVPWTVSASGPIDAKPFTELDPACIILKGKAAGVATIIAEAAGLQRTFQVQVVQSLVADAPREKATPHARGSVPGERAR
jgi:hypothetical protein